MGVPYAEVIGDPIDHSQSPLIHKFWLEKLDLGGDCRTLRVAAGDVARYIRERCTDPFWRGCNVAAPLKAEAARAAIDPDGICARIGAANALFRSPLGCAIAANTDLQGIAAALNVPNSLGQSVCLIGGGGAARAVLEFLRIRRTTEVCLIVRNVEKVRPVHRAFGISGGLYTFDNCAAAIAGAEWLINATPLGMAGHPAIPASVLDLLPETMEYGVVFDMVYVPPETALLRRARELGRRTADGITMLIEQAAPTFVLFFGERAPRQFDAELRELLTR